jgi:hypothetical protein
MGFPPNSFQSQGEPEPEGKKPKEEPKPEIKKIVDTAKTRKKPIYKRISGMFIGGSAKSASDYVVFDVMIPAAKDMIVEAGSSMIERIIFGDSRRGRRGGATPPPGGAQGFFNYNKPYTVASQQEAPRLSRQARAQHNFDEIILATRLEAEEVLENLYEIVSHYDVVTVADLYKMVGVSSNHVDTTWGWTDLTGAGVSKVRGGGFLLDLPGPKHL